MVNQKLYIINLSNFYDVISELKDHIGYKLFNFENKEIFFDKYNMMLDYLVLRSLH